MAGDMTASRKVRVFNIRFEEADAMRKRGETPPEREGIDWIRTDDGDIRHPLQHRCYESMIEAFQAARDRGSPSLT